MEVMDLADYNSDAKRTTENIPKAWDKFFEMFYNCKNVRDVHIRGFELRWFKKPLMMSPFDYEHRFNDRWNLSMTLSPGHRPIPGPTMKLAYYFLGYQKPDRLAFHQVCNLWTMTVPTSTRWFNLRQEAQRAGGSLNRLRAIQDGACQGQQRACDRNNNGGARRCDRVLV